MLDKAPGLRPSLRARSFAGFKGLGSQITPADDRGRRIRVPIRSQRLRVQGVRAAFINTDKAMRVVLWLRVSLLVLAMAVVASAAGPVFAQSGDLKVPPDAKPTGDNAKETQQKLNEIAEASRLLTGPAGNPECVWLGRRVVNLLWRDDLDTAFRHLDLYDRFGCPSAHIQATFRCLIRQGHIDPKAPETLNGKIHACWLNPGMEPPPATAAKAAPPPGDKPPPAAK